MSFSRDIGRFRPGFPPPIDLEAVKADIMNLLMERGGMTTEQLSKELKPRWSGDAVYRAARQLKDFGFIVKESHKSPWRIKLRA